MFLEQFKFYSRAYLNKLQQQNLAKPTFFMRPILEKKNWMVIFWKNILVNEYLMTAIYKSVIIV